MKKELLIIGIILIIIGSVLLLNGYKKMQPSKTERTIGLFKDIAENLTGEKIGNYTKKISTESILFLVLGGVLFIVGIVVILKSGKQNSNIYQYQKIRPKNTLYMSDNKTVNDFCPHCGAKLLGINMFCPKCGKRIED